ncbi:MAG: peptidoglycan DD-metalloendopeptidase family protein [Gemmatimonadaceae bacterium]|nr:peptidoglycan DD-metalloendopeptidase family protein [Gemmatimonadaceae bacterium]
MGLAGGVNQYGYVGGDPVNFSDPFGLDCKDSSGNRVPCPPLSGTLKLARLVGSESTRGSGFVQRTREDGSKYQHQGVDLEAAPGSDVFAMFDGVVTRAVGEEDGNAAGLRVTIKSDADGSETTSYWHLSSVDVVVGQRVTGGQKIGSSGTSGNADPAVSGRRPHLHARRQVNGQDVDPEVPQ